MRRDPSLFDAFEFIRRFCLHILPPRFMKISAYGFLTNTNKKESLAAIRKSLGQKPPQAENEPESETAAEKIKRLTGLDITCCPKCGDTLIPGPLPLPERPP